MPKTFNELMDDSIKMTVTLDRKTINYHFKTVINGFITAPLYPLF